MFSRMTILVAGATGKLGGAVAASLMERGHRVVAMTRKPDSREAKHLLKKGAKVVAGDMTWKSTLRELFSSIGEIDGVFAMTTPVEFGIRGETMQGVNMIDIANQVGVRHFVYSSVAGADRTTGVPHFDSKFRVEEHLRLSGMPYTIIAPVFFMENWKSEWFLPAIVEGNVALALPRNRKLAQIALRDLGSFVTMAFEKAEEFAGKRFEIASDVLSGQDVADRLGRKLGRHLDYYQIPIDSVRELSEDYALMYEWLDEVGFSVDAKELKRDFPQMRWTDFGAWVDGEDWSEVFKPRAKAS